MIRKHQTRFAIIRASREPNLPDVLAAKTNHALATRALAKQTMPSDGFTNFEIELLSNKKTFSIKNALVVLDFVDDENVLPHAVNTQKLAHFKKVKIPAFLQRQRIDILIGQTN